MHPRLAFSVLFLILGWFPQKTLAQGRLPIIDMHMHAATVGKDADGRPLTRGPAIRAPVRGLPHKPRRTRTC